MLMKDYRVAYRLIMNTDILVTMKRNMLILDKN